LVKSEELYVKSRCNEIENQVIPVKENLISLLDLYVSSENLFKSFEKKYSDIRRNETETQWLKIKPILDKLSVLFDNNSPYSFFYNDEKKYSISSKLKAVFNSQTSSIIKDSKKIEKGIENLIKTANQCKDFPSLKNAPSTKIKEENFRQYIIDCNSVYSNRNSSISEEFKQFELNVFFKNPLGGRPVINNIKNQLTSNNFSNGVVDFFSETIVDINNFFNKSKELTSSIHSKISSSRELGQLTVNETIDSRIDDIKDYLDYLAKLLKESKQTAKNEYESYLVKLNNGDLDLKPTKQKFAIAFGNTGFKEVKDTFIKLQSEIKEFEIVFDDTIEFISLIISESKDITFFKLENNLSKWIFQVDT